MPQVLREAPEGTIEAEVFKISPGDRANPLWQSLRTQIGKMLWQARIRNDGTLNEVDTAALRGEIRAYRKILEFAETRSVGEQPRWFDAEPDQALVPGRARF